MRVIKIRRHSGAAKQNPESRTENSQYWIPGSHFMRPGMTLELINVEAQKLIGISLEGSVG